MIIACPACSTRYVVPDSAIGIDGSELGQRALHAGYAPRQAINLVTPAEARDALAQRRSRIPGALAEVGGHPDAAGRKRRSEAS